jgi:hypothetical protein
MHVLTKEHFLLFTDDAVQLRRQSETEAVRSKQSALFFYSALALEYSERTLE